MKMAAITGWMYILQLLKKENKMIKPLTLSIFAILFLMFTAYTQNGYLQKTFQLPMSTEAKSYFVKQIGTDYVLNSDIIVGNTLQKTMLYQNNDKNRYIWPKGEIAIKLDASLTTNRTFFYKENLRQLALRAIGIFNNQTNLRLVDYNGQKDFINIKFSPDTTYGGLSPVGRVGGEQVIWITNRSDLSTFLHEMMHSFGFYHEQNRYDRDTYVVIDTSKAIAVWRYAFQIEPGVTTTAYDYTSVMHYEANAFAIKEGDQTIRCKNGNQILDCVLGGSKLSSKDIEGINSSYFYNAALPRMEYKDFMMRKAENQAVIKSTDVSKLTAINATPVENGLYKIKVNQTGKYLAIEGISKDNGARLVQWDFVDQPNHKFYVKIIAEGIYVISAAHSGKYINAAGQLKNDGTAIIQWDYANQDNVKWQLVYKKENEGSQAGWTIRNKNSNSPIGLLNLNGKNNGEAFILKNPAYADGAYEPVQTFTFERIGNLVFSEERLYENSPGMIKKMKQN